ncbi:GNAT family N-acetyltransferase [Arthrobacter sp. UYCo732]|uniref:GNAT family N-acetyltransferase n=1 Tax=Arthrobacter sp. UYCo732 TaxID=3156336 RepID=UPI0033920026
MIGKAWYKAYGGHGSVERIFYHTVINVEYAGQGLAGRLAKVALDETLAAGLRIVPVCPFTRATSPGTRNMREVPWPARPRICGSWTKRWQSGPDLLPG